MNEALAIRESSKDFLGHPRGLAFIVFTEAWERFSFYGMQALLVLYMVSQLLLPGHVENVAGFQELHRAITGIFGPLSVQALASQIFGIYVGLVYFAPVFGGLLGDRVLGRRTAVIWGAISMAAGHFLMAFEQWFLVALGLLIVGSGLLKGNLAAQVGALYPREDRRRDAAYQLYVMSINVGAFLAPLVCGTLGEVYGWHYGFGAAGVGMLASLIIYLSGARHLPNEKVRISADASPLSKRDWLIIACIAAVIALSALFWVAQTQVWNTYPVWVRDRVDRSLGGFNVPVTWFQSLDTFAVLALAPVTIWWWRRRAKTGAEPSELMKISLGLLAFGAACVLLTIGEVAAGAASVALAWPVLFHFVCAIGFLYSSPITLALISRLAPARVNAMLVGSYYLSLFAGGIISGWLGRFYEPLGPAQFWLLHAAIVSAGGLALLALSGLLHKLLGASPVQQTA